MLALERYYSIVDDIPAFVAAARRPQPLFVWTNTLRTTSRQLVDVLQQDGYDLTPLEWHPQAFRVICRDGTESLGRHWTYLAGWFHIQEASSMIPALLLDPQPGERVLDLCAAPGNKTALMAQALGNRGTVVANDIFWDRIRPLRSAIDRLGLLNVSVTCHDGTAYSRAAGEFDCVLVDVPCSCEGTSRRFPGLLKRPPTRRIPKRFRKQQLLLESAIRRCRVGGRILYSTCTFSDLQLLIKSRRDIYGVAADHRPPQMAKCISGLPLFHMHFQYPKLTTSCAATFGPTAGRNVIDASSSQLQAYLARKPFTLKKDQARACDGSGYVLMRYHNAVVGVGFYDQNQDVAASLFPKSMAAL